MQGDVAHNMYPIPAVYQRKCLTNLCKFCIVWWTVIFFEHFGENRVIIFIERKDLGGVMSKDCKDTLQTLKTVTKRQCDAK